MSSTKKPMNMAQAKAKLLEMADGTYHSIEYKLHDFGKGNVRQDCKVYVENLGSFEATHWEIALLQLERAMNGVEEDKISEDLPYSKPSDK